MSRGGRETDAASAPTIALPSLRLSPGAIIADRYEVLAALGEGGMGAVFRVLDLELREEIALKLLRLEIAEAPGVLERFRREVKLARRVTHPNVARTFDLGSWNGARFLTMELVLGESLGARAARGGRPAPLPEALRIAAEVARGLAAAHAVGVVHRDLKPDNIMLAEGRVVITDFGIARQAEAARPATVAGTIMGTPAYMAPEQLQGREVDGRSDVYALGLVLYELLCGAPAFEGDTLYAIAAARLSGETPDPRRRDASVPAPVAELVMQLLAPAREERPCAQTVVERLDALRGGAIALPDRGPQLPSAGLEVARSALAAREPRAIAVLPLTAVDEPSRALAEQLSEATTDAVAGLRGVRMVPAARARSLAATAALGGPADPVALGRAVDAGLVLEGTVRVHGDAVRARARLIDVDKGAIAWADRVQGAADDAFDLEDDLVRSVTEALRAREGADAARGGPIDKRVRDIYERARTAYARFGPTFVLEAIATLERGLEQHPDEPWLMSLLGAALARAWLQAGGTDRELIARAEELSLRALAVDPTIAETFHTIAALRWYEGDARAAVRALQEALSRAPLHAAAHHDLGRILCETGWVDQGLERLELARRIEPALLLAHFDIARVRALLGDRAGALQAIDQAVAQGGELSTIVPRLRLVVWWHDRALAAKVASALENSHTGVAWEEALPLAQAMVEDRYWPGAAAVFEQLAERARAAPQHRAFMLALAAEYFGAFDRRDEALRAIEQAAELPLIDVLWLDRCPSLACVRDDLRFVKARAMVAARAAAVWA